MSQECVRVKEEVDWESSLSGAAETELYAEHVVKEELVLGPELLQEPDISFMLQVSRGEENACTKPECPEESTTEYETYEDLQMMMKLFVCEFCDMRFKHSSELRRHESYHVRKVLRSNDAYVATRFGYINHEQNVNEEEYNCNIRMTQFSQKADLSPFKSDDNLEHLTALKQPAQKEMSGSCNYSNLRKTEEVSNFCISCSTEFQSTVGDFADHLLNHVKENPELKLLVKEHILKISQLLSVCCNVCGKQFKTQYSLMKHEKIHRGNVTCDMCKKDFTKKKSLIKHFMDCTGEKFYFCNICNRKMSRRQDFEKHLQFHTGENCCKCIICDKLFMHPASLKRHAHVHKVRVTDTEKEKRAYISVKSSNSETAKNQCITEESDSNESIQIQSVNFQESTLFNRLKLLNKTLNSNHMGKSNTNFP